MEPTKPKPFYLPPNKNEIANEWYRWKQEFLIYLRLSGGYKKYSEEKRALFLLNIMGSEALKAKQKICFDNPDDENDMDILLMKFDAIFDPPVIEANERFKFFSKKLINNEPIEDFVADLKKLASKCNFKEQTDKLIIDMIIKNVGSDLQKLIFILPNITLEDVIKTYKNYHLNHQKLKDYNKNTNKLIHEKKTWNSSGQIPQANKKRHPRSSNYCLKCQKYHNPDQSCKNRNQKATVCSKCDNNHLFGKCPADDHFCQKCCTKGHFTNKCLQKDKKEVSQALEHCDWCGLKHAQEQCKHDKDCTKCDAYPHKICFHCKKNPHETSCFYKLIITLPTKNVDPDLESFVRVIKRPNETSNNQPRRIPPTSNIFKQKRSGMNDPSCSIC